MHHSIKYKIVTATLAASILVGGISANFAPQINAAEVTSANQVAAITWGVNLREGAGSTSTKIRMISKGEQVTVLDIASNGWLKVQDKNGNVGYISNDKKYTEVTATSSTSSNSSTSTGNTNTNSSTNAGEVASTNQVATIIYGVNLREGSNTSSKKIRMISKGEQVSILGTASNGWYNVKDSKGNVGYISNDKKYTQIKSTSSTPSESTPTGNTSTTGNSNTSNNTSSNTSSSSKSAQVEKVIAAGYKYLGTPYEYGSSRSNTRTFDCSDFVRQAFIDGLGITLPSDSRKQGAYVKELGNVKTSINQLERGDLMFFMSYKGTSKSSYSNVNKSNQTITHVGIYLGDGKILHTYSNEGGGVTTSTVTNSHWEYRFLYGGSAIK